MSDFFAELFARNLPPTSGAHDKAASQARLRPRLPSLFEAVSTDIVGADMAIAESGDSFDNEAEPPVTTSHNVHASKLLSGRFAAATRPGEATRSEQRDDPSIAHQAVQHGAPAERVEAAVPARVSAARRALAADSLHIDPANSVAMPATTLEVRASRNSQQRSDARATQLQPLPSQPPSPTPRVDSERDAQPRQTRDVDSATLRSPPTDRTSASHSAPRPPAVLNAATPTTLTALDAALRAGLQALANNRHERTHRQVPDNGNAGDSEAVRQTIAVSIGRIEIRATHGGTSPATSARKEKTGPQPLALDDYLRQRASGVRE